MLLRKQLEDGRITKISQLGLDRVIKIEIDTLGAARQIVTKTLIFELTGRNGNVIFAENDIIIDALRHVGRNMSSFRLILAGPGVSAAPPPQTGLSIVEACPATIINLLSEQVAANCLDGLIACTTGIGKFTALQLLRQSGINPLQRF
jgi:predicted ribosome quality control (RQC) complex YloA/Tae2 family protein